MKLEKQTEEKLKNKVLQFLKKGRQGWDIPHALAAVHWIKKLIEKEGGDERILVPTMYLHDIGYTNLEKGYGLDDVMALKEAHVKIAIKESEEILTDLGFSETETKKIIDLIKHHDEFDNLDTHNGILVMEADSLAQIDWERVTPTFDKENCLDFLKDFREIRVPKFKTKTGVHFLNIVLPKAEHYWD